MQKVQQSQHKTSCNSWTIVLTWPQKSGSVKWQVCNDFMVLADIAGSIGVLPLVTYLMDLLLRRKFQRRIAHGMSFPDDISNFHNCLESSVTSTSF